MQKIQSRWLINLIIDYCVVTEIEAIKREIIKNGPVIAVTPIYRDFLTYKSGIYQTNDVNSI